MITNLSRIFLPFIPSTQNVLLEVAQKVSNPIPVPKLVVPNDLPHWVTQELVFQQCYQFLLSYFEISKSTLTYVGKSNGYQVTVDRSSALNSGNGVFAQRPFKQGEVVSFYPGVYYPPLPTWLISLPDGFIAPDLRPRNFPEIYEDVYKIHCPLGGFLEAKNSQSSNLALAHIINHPPKGEIPSVLSYSFYWNDFLQWIDHSKHPSSDLTQWIQDEVIPMVSRLAENEPWHVDPYTEEVVYLNSSSAPLVGIVFISNRNIAKGEELFYDYKFKPSKSLPAWYHPVSESEST